MVDGWLPSILHHVGNGMAMMVGCHWVAIHYEQPWTIHHFFVDKWLMAIIHDMEALAINHPSSIMAWQ
jgi:hypothetical protein